MKASAVLFIATLMVSLAHAQRDKADALDKIKKIKERMASSKIDLKKNDKKSTAKIAGLINQIKDRKQERKVERLTDDKKGKNPLGKDKECDEDKDKKPRPTPTPTPMPYASAASPVRTPVPTQTRAADSANIVSGSIDGTSVSGSVSVFAMLAVFLI